MAIITQIILVILAIPVTILLVAYLGSKLSDVFWARKVYARKKCEEQKLACANNFKHKSRSNTIYKTVVLNTPNVVDV